MAKVKPGGLINVQMPKVMKVITISDDGESNEEQQQELKERPMEKHQVVEICDREDDEDEDDKGKDNEDQEDNNTPYISRETVDGYLVSIIGHLEEYTWPPDRATGLSEEVICITCRWLRLQPSSESTKDCWSPANSISKKYGTTPGHSQSSPPLRAPNSSTKT